MMTNEFRIYFDANGKRRSFVCSAQDIELALDKFSSYCIRRYGIEMEPGRILAPRFH